MDVGDTVFKDEDSGNILRRGVVAELYSTDGMVRVEWEHMPGYLVWEELCEIYTVDGRHSSRCNHRTVKMVPAPPDDDFDW